MSLRDVCTFLCVVLSVQALPLPHKKIDLPKTSQKIEASYRLRFPSYHQLRDPVPGFSEMSYGRQSSTDEQQSSSRLVIDLGQDTSEFHRKTIPKIKPVINRFGNPIWLYKKDILSDRKFRLFASAAKERLKQAFLRQQALIDRMHSIEWRDKFGKIPLHTMNEDHVIVKKPGAHVDVIFPPNTEAPSNSSSVYPVIQPTTIQHSGISGLHQGTEILPAEVTDTPEVDQAVEISDSFDNHEATKPLLPSDDLVSIDLLASTPKPMESILDNLIFDESTAELPFTEFSGATVESVTVFEAVPILSGIGNEETVDAEVATPSVEISSSAAPSETTLKTKMTWLEPLEHSQTTMESGIKPEPVASSVIDVESIAEVNGPITSSTIIYPTPSITAEEFTSSIVGAETTSQVSSTSSPNSLIDTASVTEETLVESPVLETIVGEHGIADSTIDGLINDAESTTGIDSTFLASTLPSQMTTNLEEVYSTTEKHFDILPIEVEIIDETSSMFSSATTIKPFTPLDDVTIDVVTSFDNSSNDVETSTNLVWTYPAFIVSTEVYFNSNDTVYDSIASVGTSTQDAEITADLAASSPYGVSHEIGVNWNQGPSIMHTVSQTPITAGEHTAETVPKLPETTKAFDETFSTSGTLLEASTNNTETTTIVDWAFAPSTFSTEASPNFSDMSLTEVTPYHSFETEADTTAEMISSMYPTTLTATITILEEKNESEEVRLSDLKYDLDAITNIISTTPAPIPPIETIDDSNEISSNADTFVQTSTSRAKLIVDTVSKLSTPTARPATTMTYDQMFVITNAPFETLSTNEKISPVEVVSINQHTILTEKTTTLDGKLILADIPVNSLTNDVKITMDVPAEKYTTLDALSTIGSAYPESNVVTWTLTSATSDLPMIRNEIHSNTDPANVSSTDNKEGTTEIVLTSVSEIPLEVDDGPNSENGAGADEDSDYSVRHQKHSSDTTVYPYTTSISSISIGGKLTETFSTAPADVILETTNVENGTEIGVEDSGYSMGKKDKSDYSILSTDPTVNFTSYVEAITEIISADTPMVITDVSTSENDLEIVHDFGTSTESQENGDYSTATMDLDSIISSSDGELINDNVLTATDDVSSATDDLDDDWDNTEFNEGSNAPLTTDAAFISYTSHQESTKEIISMLPTNTILNVEVEEDHLKNQDASSYAPASVEPDSISSTNNKEPIMDVASTDTLPESFDVSNSEDDVDIENGSEYTIKNQDSNGRTVATTNLTSIGVTSDEETNTESVLTSPADILIETDDSLNSAADDELEKGDEYPIGKKDNRDYVTQNTDTVFTISSQSYEKSITEIISSDALLEINDAVISGKDLNLEQDSRYLSTNEENNGYATATTGLTYIGSTSYGEASTAMILTTPADIVHKTTKVLLSEDDTNVEEDSGRLTANHDERADNPTASPDHEETTTEIVLTPPADILNETDDSLNFAADDELEKGDEYPVGKKDNRDYVTENTDTVTEIGSTSYENMPSEIISTDTFVEANDASSAEKDLELEHDSRHLSTNEETNVEEDSGRLTANHDERADNPTASPDHEETTTEIVLTPPADILTETDDSLNSAADDELEKGDEYPVGKKDNRDYVTQNTDTLSTISSQSYEKSVTEIISSDALLEANDASTSEKDLELEHNSRYLSTNEDANGHTTATADVTPIDLKSYRESSVATILTTPVNLLLETTKVLISEDDASVEKYSGRLMENHDESQYATAFPENKSAISEIGSVATLDDMSTSVGNVEVQPSSGYLVQGKSSSDYSEYQTDADLDLESPRSLYTSIVTPDQKNLLSLIPLVIEELRKNNLNTKAKNKLSQIFGDIWPLMMDESNRRPWEFMNHQLAMILFAADQHATVDAGPRQNIGLDSFINTERKEFEQSANSRINQEQVTQLYNLYDLEDENMKTFLQVEHQQLRRAKKNAAMDLELKSEVVPQTGHIESDPVIDADI